MNYSIIFDNNIDTVVLALKVRKDTPFSADEHSVLQKLLSNQLNLPIVLKTETEPFITPLIFKRWDTTISDEMRSKILELKDVYAKIKINIEVYPERRNALRQARERLNAVIAVLSTNCHISVEAITYTIYDKYVDRSVVKITVSQS
ncbi:hypothetical protein [Candidatus Magnetomonas plexicatena]|uniref:hypothetical protein n=1 Tax=Candidatus Magnetomonas plexicatena TaxID=2552947 RepID=UPI001103AF4D|nr:hypothetical protein E2O03_014140 [Nitrospirales bacterium LBB_01]